MRYIENSGWNDYVFRKLKDGTSPNEDVFNDFSDDAFKRSHILQTSYNHIKLSAVKEKI